MARMLGVAREKAHWIARLFYWGVRRRTGRLADTWTIAAHAPGLLAAMGVFELALDRSRHVERRLRKLAEIKAAMLVGCPA